MPGTLPSVLSVNLHTALLLPSCLPIGTLRQIEAKEYGQGCIVSKQQQWDSAQLHLTAEPRLWPLCGSASLTPASAPRLLCLPCYCHLLKSHQLLMAHLKYFDHQAVPNTHTLLSPVLEESLHVSCPACMIKVVHFAPLCTL